MAYSSYSFTDEGINNLMDIINLGGSIEFRKRIKYLAFSELGFIIENAFRILHALFCLYRISQSSR